MCGSENDASSENEQLLSRSIDSDEEANNNLTPNLGLNNVGNKPDLCLLTLGALDTDSACNGTANGNLPSPGHTGSINHISGANHISNVTAINNSNKNPGVGMWIFEICVLLYIDDYKQICSCGSSGSHRVFFFFDRTDVTESQEKDPGPVC